MRLVVLLLLFFLIPLRAFAADPEAEIEKIIGKPLSEAFKAQYGVVNDPTVQAWVNRVGGQVAAQSPRQDVRYSFTVLDTDLINAFSLPGGYVFITRGLLQDSDSDDELAGVLGHEVGHETHYDAVKLAAASAALDLLNADVIKPRTDLQAAGLDVADVLAMLSLSRHDEAMADQAGVDFSARAGYDPNAFLHFFESEGEGNETGIAKLLQTHPPDKDRVRRIKARMATLTPADWQKIGDSLVARDQFSAAASAYTLAHEPALAAQAEQQAQALPSPTPSTPPASYAPAEQTRFMDKIEHARAGLRQADRTDRITSTLQQILLFEFPTQDAASILVAAQAYAAVEQAESVFSEAAFVTRTSPGYWDSLSQYTAAPAGSLASINAAQAAGDLSHAAQTVQGVPGPLQTTEDVLAAALLDLDSPAIRVHDSGARWAQYGAVEAAALTADSQISRAQKSAAEARKSVASGELRILEQQLDFYPTSPAYTQIAARQLNVSPNLVDQMVAATSANGQGGYGTAAVLIALAAEARQDPLSRASERAANQNESAVDMARSAGASLASLDITLRMIRLDFEHARTALPPAPTPGEKEAPNTSPAAPLPATPVTQSTPPLDMGRQGGVSPENGPPPTPPYQGGANAMPSQSGAQATTPGTTN